MSRVRIYLDTQELRDILHSLRTNIEVLQGLQIPYSIDPEKLEQIKNEMDRVTKLVERLEKALNKLNRIGGGDNVVDSDDEV